MGGYLDKPVTDKDSADDENDKLLVGSSSMQGWREAQEDAHNCILDYDKNISFFAVYDGHGGFEVAEYCSRYLPDYIKNTEAYKKGDYEKALVDAFLGFDATIKTHRVYKKLLSIVEERKNPIVETDDESGDDEEEDDEVEENVSNLYEEATMPIEEVIEKYGAQIKKLANAKLKQLRKGDVENASNSTSSDASSSTTVTSPDGDLNHTIECAGDGVSSTSNSSNEANNTNHVQDESITASTKADNGPPNIPEIKIDSPDSSSTKEVTSSKATKNEAVAESSSDQQTQNGQVAAPDENKSDIISSTVLENGEITKKGKGKALAKTKGVKTPPNKRPKREASQLYQNLLKFEESEESEDEEDKTFEGPNEESSDEDEYENVHINVDDSESSQCDEEECDEDCPDDDSDVDGDAPAKYPPGLSLKPGYESGCTAVVALLVGSQLYVANAGDSRCIISRNGKAIEMSLDHSPVLEMEMKRVEKAGGYVSALGARVNGGLNLSRAIGDHSYKRNEKLSEREQLIIALPDIRTTTINPKEDEFMVLACDGIWNSMSSQKVVDFVLPRMKEGKKLSQICEELFDECLSPDTWHNEYEGCDNMTAVIVQFKKSLLKRPSSTEPEEVESRCTKREKTDNNEAVKS